MNRNELEGALKHLKTISYHKYLVMQGCFAVGLYAQGLTHDLSKYSPTEFAVGARYFQGNRSPNNAEREEKGYSAAWLHHKGRNRHHFEYWLDYNDQGMAPARMPVQYVIEMFMDRIAASKVYMKEAYTDRSPLDYYLRGTGAYAYMHERTRKQLHVLLLMLAREGEEETFRFIREEILHR